MSPWDMACSSSLSPPCQLFLLSRLEHGQIIPLSEVNSSYIARGQLAQAISLAINDHIPLGQTRVQALSDWNGLADAEAGRNAVFAARLARAGLTGPAPIFEGGFFKQVSGPADVEVGAFGRRGVPFRIHQCGMKAYPAVVYAQTAIAAGIEVARKVGSLDRVRQSVKRWQTHIQHRGEVVAVSQTRLAARASNGQ